MGRVQKPTTAGWDRTTDLLIHSQQVLLSLTAATGKKMVSSVRLQMNLDKLYFKLRDTLVVSKSFDLPPLSVNIL